MPVRPHPSRALTVLLAMAAASVVTTVAAPVAPVAATGSVHTVCASGCGYTSIQAAVNAANAGDTVSVSAGTYDEAVVVGKRLNLIGPNADVSPTTISAGSTGWTGRSEAMIQPSTASATPLTLNNDAAGSVISGLTFKNTSDTNQHAISVNGSAAGVTVRRNRIQSATHGIFNYSQTALTGWTVEDNSIEGLPGMSTTPSGLLFQYLGANVTVSANHISGFGRGIQFQTGATTGNRWTVTGNLLENNLRRGLQIGQAPTGTDVVVRDNVFLGNNANAASDAYSAALRILDTTNENRQASYTIAGNTFRGNFGSALAWGDEQFVKLAPTNATISGNTFDIPSGAYAMSYSGPSNVTVSARDNIWIARGPLASLFRTLPQKTLATGESSLLPTPTNVVFDTAGAVLPCNPTVRAVYPAGATPPDGCGYMAIATAISHAAPGDTILLMEGTYSGDVNINRPGVTLRAASFGSYSPGATVSGKVTIAADDVTVQGLRIQSTGSSGVYVAGGKDSPRVLDNVIEDPQNMSKDGSTSDDRRAILTSGWTGTLEIARNTISGFITAAYLQGTLTSAAAAQVRDNVVRDLDPFRDGNIAFANDQQGGSTLYEGNTITGPNVYGGIATLATSSNIVVSGNTITGLSGMAIMPLGTAHRIVDNNLSRNGTGIFISGDHPDAIRTMQIRNNNLANQTQTVGLYIYQSPSRDTLDIRENYWAKEPQSWGPNFGRYNSTIIDYRPNASAGSVSARPYLAAPNGSPVLTNGSIQVVVADVAGVAIGGVQVALIGPDGESPAYNTATTDVGGRAMFTGRSAGLYRVTIAASAGVVDGPAERSVNLAAGSAATVDFRVITTGSISGRVVDTAGVGVSGVVVSSGAKAATTDNLGRYTLADMGVATHTVSIAASPKAGYVPTGPISRLVNVAANGAATADFVLAQTQTVAGSVVDFAGNGVPGVTVTLAGVGSTVTGASGRYSFANLTTGQAYTVTIAASGTGLPSGFVAAGPTSRQVFLAAGGATGADFVLARTLSVLVRVVDTLGAPIAGVPVTVGAATSPTGVDGTTTSAVAGTGIVTVSAAAPSGFTVVGPSSTQVNIGAGSSATVTFVMARTSSITGRVVDTGGVGVGGVTVALSGAGDGSTTTRPDGTYQFTGLASTGSHTVSITPPSGFAASGATQRIVNLASGGSGTASFVLAEQGAITGRVVDDTGAGIAGVTVALSGGGASTTTGLDGYYRFDRLTAGQTLTVTVTPPANFVEPTNQTGRLSQSVAVGSSALDVVLLPPGTVSGFAFLDLDGDGIRTDDEPTLGGIGVTLLRPGNSSLTATTSATGYYRFDNAPANASVVLGTTGSFVGLTQSIAATNVLRAGRASLRNGGYTQFLQDFPMLPPGVIAGAVLLPDGSPLGGVEVTITGRPNITTGPDGTFYVSEMSPGAYTITALPPNGFFSTGASTRSVTLTPASSSATTLLTISTTATGGTGNLPPPPSGPTVGSPIRVPVATGRTPVVRVDTPAGLVELYFTGLEVLDTDAGVIVTPVTPSRSDRGVVSSGMRFRLASERLRFASVEVCLQVDAAAFRELGTDVDRLRLIHMRADGTEIDITGTVNLDADPAQVCGTATSFSEFQVVVLAPARIAGDDRYATAAEVALDQYPRGVSTVYVATGEQHPDALVAGLAAADEGAPLLLVRAGAVPDATRRALETLDPERIVIVGGEAAVTAAVASELAALTGASVSRLAGADRYGTAAAAALAQSPNGVGTVYIATGVSFPDALAAGVVAGRDGAALLLMPAGSIPASVDAALRALAPRSIVVVGGEAAISATGVDSLGVYGATVTRIGGVDRYDTAAQLMADRPAGGSIVVTTGRTFPDALAATPLAIRTGAALLLVNGDSVPSAVRSRIAELAPRTITVVGGTAAVGGTAELSLARLLQPSVPGRL